MDKKKLVLSLEDGLKSGISERIGEEKRPVSGWLNGPEIQDFTEGIGVVGCKNNRKTHI